MTYYAVLFSCEPLWMQITADVGKISKTVQYYLMFIFDELSEFFVIFASNLMFSAVKNVVSFTKDDKEVSWMYHRVIRFWFLLNFLFISALFDILALLLSHLLCSSKWLFRQTEILLFRHSQNNYQMRLYKLNLMCEGLSCQIINTSTANQAVFCYY